MNDLNEKMEASRKRVMNIAFRFTRNREAAEDLTQDVMMKVFENVDKFDATKADFETWVAVVAKRMCIDRYRSSKREAETINVFADLSEMQVASSELSQEEVVFRSQVRQAVGKLDSDLRDVVLSQLDGQSYEEAAAKLNVNVGTVKSRMNRAKKQLKGAF